MLEVTQPAVATAELDSKYWLASQPNRHPPEGPRRREDRRRPDPFEIPIEQPCIRLEIKARLRVKNELLEPVAPRRNRLALRTFLITTMVLLPDARLHLWTR